VATGARPDVSSSLHPTSQPCRLCGGDARPLFQKRIRHEHLVQYFECGACGSLQTETPHWLDAAYKDARRFTDTFGSTRAQRNQVLAFYLFRLLGLDPADRVVDWGGGDGLTTRVLRDVGLDAYSCDRYATNVYAAGFEGGLETGLGLITSFEVWEHFATPADDVRALFDCRPKALFVSTGIYLGQGPRWPYLAPYSGRHIFFYSPGGMAWIAKTFGYDHVVAGDYAVFSQRALSGLQRRVIALLLSGRLYRILKAWLALKPPRGLTTSDWLKMRRLVKDDDV
jgi:hypothetical protein